MGPFGVRDHVTPHLFSRSGSKDDRLRGQKKISVVGDEVRRTLPFVSRRVVHRGSYFVRKIVFSAELMVSYFYLIIAFDPCDHNRPLRSRP
jgi:hypothetical protein